MSDLFPLSSAEDSVLVARATDGDVPAFETLVRRYGPLMRAFATRLLGSTESSDDVVQDAFITAWKQLDRLDNPSVVKSWLMRIVSRNCMDRIRGFRSHVDIDEYDQPAPIATTPESIAQARSLTEALSSAISGLPPQQRQCWLLREVSNYSYDEIAGEMDIPIATVRGTLARARHTLAVEMEAWK